MSTAMVATLFAVGAFLAALALSSRRRARLGQPGMREAYVIMIVLALISLTTAVGELLIDRPTAYRIAAGMTGVSLAAIPPLLVRFVDAFEPVERWLRLGVIPVTVVFAVLLALEPGGLADARIAPHPVVAPAFTTFWMVGFGFAALRLWAGGRRQRAAVIRRRAQHMAVGLLGFAVVMPVALIEPVFVEDGMAVTTAFGIAALVLFATGFVAPAALRASWARHDRAELHGAEVALMQLDTAEEIAAELLPTVSRYLGGTAAWLVEDDQLLAVDGEPSELIQLDPPAGEEHARLVRAGDRPVVAAPTGLEGWLFVEVSPYSAFLGAHELETVSAIAVRLGLAMDRARLRRREIEMVRELEAARRIRELEGLRDDVLSTLSHELRTPLTAVMGAAELLEERWAELDRSRRDLLFGRLRRNVEDLHRAVRDVLDVAADVTSTPLRPRRIALRTVVETATGSLDRALSAHDLAVDVPADLEVVTDPDLVSRIVEQLLTNAAKFSEPGSRIEIGATGADDAVHLAVRDQGVGMDQEELDRAFEPFFRTGDVLRRETRGLGVGLTVAALLAGRIGATLRANSAPSEGSEFVLDIPVEVRTAPHDEGIEPVRTRAADR